MRLAVFFTGLCEEQGTTAGVVLKLRGLFLPVPLIKVKLYWSLCGGPLLESMWWSSMHGYFHIC